MDPIAGHLQHGEHAGGAVTHAIVGLTRWRFPATLAARVDV